MDLGIRSELHLYKEGTRWMKPNAYFTMIPDERKAFGAYIKSVRFSDGFASNLSKNVNPENEKITGLKSHNFHVIMQRLLAPGVRRFLPKEINDTITELSSFFQLMCAQTLKIDDLKAAQQRVIIILCKLELIFPPILFDIMVHLVMHLPNEVIEG